GHRDHRRLGAVPLLGPALQGRVPRGVEHRAARRHHRGRRVSRVPAVQLQPGAHLHRRRGRAVPRALMATMTITIGGRADYVYPGQTYFFYAPLFIPVVILGVPMLDTAFSFVRRVARRQSFAVADKNHLHHRLMRLGHGPRRTVVILWSWTALLSALALLPLYVKRGNGLVPVGVLGLGLLLYAVFHPGAREARRGHGDPVVAADGDGTDDAVVDLESRRRGARVAVGAHGPAPRTRRGRGPRSGRSV